LLVDECRVATAAVGAACAQDQRLRHRIDDREVDERRDIVMVALEHVRADDRQVAERPFVLVQVLDLVVRDQRHDVDRVQALHALQAGEAAVVAQVVVGDRDDLRDELAVGEALADELQQLIALDRGRPGAALGRQERQPDAQRHPQLGHLILRGRNAAVRVEELDQARRIVRLAGLVRHAHQGA